MGDFGASAREWVDTLRAAGVGIWQILPLSPPGRGWSPYASPSSMGINTLLISLDSLVHSGLLTRDEMEGSPPVVDHHVNFDAIQAWKVPRLRQAAERFIRDADRSALDGYRQFCARQGAWLVNHADFTALKRRFHNGPWTDWDPPLRDRDPAALQRAREEDSLEREIEKALQWFAHSQWNALREYAGHAGIGILGDVGYYVAHDSADVWAHRACFQLDPEGQMQGQGGAPPDAYAEEGQCWETPLHRWETHHTERYKWWRRRFRMASLQTRHIRLDHFNGVTRYWAIPESASTAADGAWAPGPGGNLLQALTEILPEDTIIAEDLGSETPGGDELRGRWGIPGMRVLQFAIGAPADNPHHPEQIREDICYCASTHDAPPVEEWIRSLNASDHKDLEAMAGGSDVWDVLACVWRSKACLATAQIQDVLALGSAHRMNRPGTEEGNWTWSLPKELLHGGWTERLKALNEATGRCADA